MASKASKGTLLTPLPKTPQTYKDIKTLNLKELKALCKDANIPTEGIGRDALEILFALEVGISTSGSKKDEANQNNADSGTLQKSLLDPRQLKEFYSLTPTNVIKQPGWKKDISGLPDLDVSVVKSYLNNSKKEEFSAESLKRYKTTRAYEHIEANHICNMAFNGLAKSNTFCVVRASCLPSQSGDDVKIKYLHVILDKWTGEPYGGFCTCTVGLGQACSHIGALLFLLAEHVATGKNLPDDVSVTEIPAAWKDPKSAKVVPVQADKILVNRSGKSTYSASTYGTNVAPELTKDEKYQRVLKLLYDVRNANRTLVPPIVNIVDLSKFRPEPSPQTLPLTSLPDKCMELDQNLAYSSMVEIKTTPSVPSILSIPHLCFDDPTDDGFDEERDNFISKLSNISAMDRKNIEIITRGQLKNQEWYNQRADVILNPDNLADEEDSISGAITASNVFRVLQFMRSGHQECRSLLSEIMVYDVKDISHLPAVQWGIKNESTALEAFLKKFKMSHNEVEVVTTGLMTHKEYPYIRASPDAVVYCSCHGSIIIEIKCPYKIRNITPQQALDENKIECLSLGDNGKPILLKKHSYYHQITTQMAVSSGITNAVFVLWTKCGMISLDVPFDSIYWEFSILPQLRSFFKDVVISEILTKKLKKRKELKPQEQDFQPDLEEEMDTSSQCNGNTSDGQPDLVEEMDSSSQCNENTSVEDKNKVDDPAAYMSPVKVLIPQDKENWNLGCAAYCKDHRSPNYSKVKGKMLECGVNLVCPQNTRYHWFCEGFRRLSIDYEKKTYVCQRCRPKHPEYEMLRKSNGFI